MKYIWGRVEWGRERERERYDGIKQFVRSCVPPTQRQIGGNLKPFYRSIWVHGHRLCVCTSVFMCVTESWCACAGLLCTCVCWLRSSCVSLSVFSRRHRAVGREEGMEGHLSLSVWGGGVGRVNAVSCSLSDYVHTVPAKFEIFFSSFWCYYFARRFCDLKIGTFCLAG